MKNRPAGVFLQRFMRPKRKRRARGKPTLCAYLYLRKITSCCSDIPEWQKRPCQHPGRVRHMRPQGTRGWRTGSLRSACRTASAHSDAAVIIQHFAHSGLLCDFHLKTSFLGIASHRVAPIYPYKSNSRKLRVNSNLHEFSIQ